MKKTKATAKGYWIYIRRNKNDRWTKLPQPFASRANAMNYIRRTRRFDKPRLEYKIVYGKRTIQKALKSVGLRKD